MDTFCFLTLRELATIYFSDALFIPQDVNLHQIHEVESENVLSFIYNTHYCILLFNVALKIDGLSCARCY